MKVMLSASEVKLVNVLLYVKDVEIRFAGGWVRDKLLGINSNDIDVALENVTGAEYIRSLQNALSHHHEENLVSHIGKIALNPDQSKHLETITANVCGFECDFVNLRSETYALHSRIPEMEFGSAKQDAMRRDFTINSLFYNLRSRALEDLTQNGIKDLNDGIIRTPMNATVTFLDDPLRIIRGFRFAAKLKFKVCDEIMRACEIPEILLALKQKVSNERVVIEIDKILSSANPDYGIHLLCQSGVYSSIFEKEIPLDVKRNSKKIRITIEMRKEPHYVALISRLLNLQKLTKILNFDIDGVKYRLLYLAALYLPYIDSTISHDSNAEFSNFLTVHHFKFSKKDNNFAIELASKACKLQKLVFSKSLDTLSKLEFGTLLREHSIEKDFNLSLMLASIINIASRASIEFDSNSLKYSENIDPDILDLTKLTCENIFDRIKCLDFENITSWKPILNGKDVMKLKCVEGVEVGCWLNKILAYQIENHPTDRNQVLSWLESQKHY
eukprot:NODE_101_length_19951_cov_0.932501.p3 type:complete len:501 gc:universal NODE_101_length_19951_cov_0.932501:18784-17282(-)